MCCSKLQNVGNIYNAGLIFNKNHPTLLHIMFYRLLIPLIAAWATFTDSVSGKANRSSSPLPRPWDGFSAVCLLGDHPWSQELTAFLKMEAEFVSFTWLWVVNRPISCCRAAW